MDINKIAERAAKRKNKKIAERYPLFPDHFATTAEAEKARILRQRIEADEWLAKLKRLSLEAWERGKQYREVAKRLLPRDEFERLDQKWSRLFGNRDPEWDGALLSDFWFEAIYGTEWAFEHCPNKRWHNNPVWYLPRWNFLLGRWIKTECCPTCGYKP